MAMARAGLPLARGEVGECSVSRSGQALVVERVRVLEQVAAFLHAHLEEKTAAPVLELGHELTFVIERRAAIGLPVEQRDERGGAGAQAVVELRGEQRAGADVDGAAEHGEQQRARRDEREGEPRADAFHGASST